MEARLQKILSQWGIASRREAEKMILAGRVRLNDSPAQLGQRADPMRDRIEVDGQVLQGEKRPSLLYLLLHKPIGVVSTCRDPRQRSTVLDLLPSELRQGQGLHPVGRLDANSSGALLLTNDGELTLRLTHPRYHIPKTYHVWVEGSPSPSVLETWRQGVDLDGRKTLRAQVRILKRCPNKTQLEIVLKEGRNRQIRRVAEQLGYPVIALHRTAIGSVRLQSWQGAALSPGHYRYLSDLEIHYLKQQTDLDITIKHWQPSRSAIYEQRSN